MDFVLSLIKKKTLLYLAPAAVIVVRARWLTAGRLSVLEGCQLSQGEIAQHHNNHNIVNTRLVWKYRRGKWL